MGSSVAKEGVNSRMSIKKLFFDRLIGQNAEISRFEKKLGLTAQPVDDVRAIYASLTGARDPIGAGKEILFLTWNQGPFIRECPGTRHYVCCGYKILHIGTFCTMDCAYCILQSYFHPPMLQYFLNHDRMEAQLHALFRLGEISRVGTGEFTDSLIWEIWTPLSQRLIGLFSAQQRAVLELKTKTTAIDSFKSLHHNRKTILAWSVNTERIIQTQERGTASLDSRLKAAAKAQHWGYPVALHFDPIIDYPEAAKEYRAVIGKIFDCISPENIVWISLGSLRFMPDLKPVIRQRFPDSKIPFGEFITGVDGKMRYFKPLRLALYQRIAHEILDRAPGVCVYFCMEDDIVWERTFGFTPEGRGGLPAMLDAAAAAHCGVVPATLPSASWPLR